MKKLNQRYNYQESGIPNIFLEGISTSKEKEYITIPNIYKLHKIISQRLLSSPGKLRGCNFKFIRTELGLNYKKFSRLIGTTIKYWKEIEAEKRTLTKMEEASFRIFAMEKLKLGEYSYQEVINWCNKKRNPKEKIIIPIKEYAN